MNKHLSQRDLDHWRISVPDNWMTPCAISMNDLEGALRGTLGVDYLG